MIRPTLGRSLTLGCLGLFGVLAAAGCTEDGGTTLVSTAADSSGIVVVGAGEASAPPDTAFITVGVQVTQPSVEAARSEAARSAAAVIAAVKKAGVEDRDVRTTQFSISPNYVYPRDGGEPKITGYTVSNTLELKVRKLDALSAVIDDAAEAGGDAVRVNSVRFDIDDPTKLYEAARALAMKDARAKAEQLAALGNVKLGKPISIAETQAERPIQDTVRSAALAKEATPIEAGTTAITVTVSVRWAIE